MLSSYSHSSLSPHSYNLSIGQLFSSADLIYPTSTTLALLAYHLIVCLFNLNILSEYEPIDANLFEPASTPVSAQLSAQIVVYQEDASSDRND